MTNQRILELQNDGSIKTKTNSKKDKSTDQNKLIQSVSITSELGLSVALPIVGGALIGKLLDGYFHSSPKMTLSIIILGLVLGITNMYFIIKRIVKS